AGGGGGRGERRRCSGRVGGGRGPRAGRGRDGGGPAFGERTPSPTRHIESRFRHRTVRVEREGPDALGRVFIGAERSGFYSVAVGDHVGPPGMMRAFLRGETEQGAVNASAIDAREVPAFVEKAARLALMDEQEVEACIMLPTFGIGVEYQLRRDPDALYASLASYNRWIEEAWGFGGDRRIFSTPLLSIADVDNA